MFLSLHSYGQWIEKVLNEETSAKIDFCDLRFGNSRRDFAGEFYEFPYLARLEIEYKYDLIGFALGVLIHPRYVLTAASSFYEFKQLSWDKQYPKIHVKLATENYTIEHFQPWEFYGGIVNEMFYPKEYNSRVENDIAILRLQKRVPVGVRTGNRELPLAKFKTYTNNDLDKKSYLIPTFEDFRWVHKIHYGLTSRVHGQRECNTGSGGLLCTKYKGNFWAFPEGDSVCIIKINDKIKSVLKVEENVPMH